MKKSKGIAIAAVAALSLTGSASASTKHNPCGVDKPDHEHHKKHQHDHGGKPCDCDSIWKTIKELVRRIEILEAKPSVGTPGPVGPAGPAGPAGPIGPKGSPGRVVVLTPVIVFPSQPLKPGCAYVQVGGKRVGSTYRIQVGAVCASSTRVPPVAG